MASGKSLKTDENEAAREVLRGLMDREFNSNQTALARALKLSQPTVSDFLNRKNGVGPKLLKHVGRYDLPTALRMIGLDADDDPAILSTYETLVAGGASHDVARWAARAAASAPRGDAVALGKVLVAIGSAFGETAPSAAGPAEPASAVSTPRRR